MALNPDYSTPIGGVRDRVNDNLVRNVNCAAWPASYATGGVPIDNTNDFGWRETRSVNGMITDGTTYYDLWLDYANQKIKVISQSTGNEVSNATNLSAFKGIILFIGG